MNFGKSNLKVNYNPWISVKKEHAPSLKTVILYGPDIGVIVGWNEAVGTEDASYVSWEKTSIHDEITHWAPLPDAPS